MSSVAMPPVREAPSTPPEIAVCRIMRHMRCPHGGRGGRTGASRHASVANPLHILRLLVRLMAALPWVASAVALAQSPDASDWGYYGGDAFGQRFSSLDEINRGNVSHLQVAWIYRTGELGVGFARAGKLTFEATPVLAFGLLYLETGTN